MTAQALGHMPDDGAHLATGMNNYLGVGDPAGGGVLPTTSFLRAFNANASAIAASTAFPINEQSFIGVSQSAANITAGQATTPTVNIAGPAMTWTPIGGTPQNMNFQDFNSLLSAITQRRATLQANKATLKNSLNAMTTVGAVAGQDITAGW
jgi:hypothetical protein